MCTSSTLHVRISPQWLSEMRDYGWALLGELCVSSLPWWILTLCPDSMVSPLQLHWGKSVCMFVCSVTCHLYFWQNNLFFFFFTCHCSKVGVEQTLNKRQHRMSTLEKNSRTAPAGNWPATFWSRVSRSTNWAILTNGHGMIKGCNLSSFAWSIGSCSINCMQTCSICWRTRHNRSYCVQRLRWLYVCKSLWWVRQSTAHNHGGRNN